MKIFAIIIGLSLVRCAIPAHAAISCARTTIDNQSSGTSFTIPSSTAGHQGILVVLGNNTSTVITAVSGAGTWTIWTATAGSDSGGGNGGEIAYNTNETGGVTSLTVTTSPAGTDAIAYYDCTGINTSSPQGGAAVDNNHGASTNPSCSSVTPTVANEFFVSGLGEASTTATAVDNSFGNLHTDSTLLTGEADLLASDSSAHNSTWTNSTSQTWYCITAGFQPSGGGGGGSTPGFDKQHRYELMEGASRILRPGSGQAGSGGLRRAEIKNEKTAPLETKGAAPGRNVSWAGGL